MQVSTRMLMGAIGWFFTISSVALAEPPSADDSFHAVGTVQVDSHQAHESTSKSTQATHVSQEHEAQKAVHSVNMTSSENGANHTEIHYGEHAQSHEGGHAGGHNHFAGTFTFITDEYKSTKANVTNVPAEVAGLGKSELAPAAALGVNFALTPESTLGIVISGDLKKGEYGAYESESTTVKLDENRHYELAFEPGIVLAPKWLGFLILGLHQANVTAETSINSVELSDTKNMYGYSIGFGSKLVLAEHVFGIFEYQHLEYSGISISGIRIAPATDAVSLGLGYHF
jgi:opacity protein-like surface antigen